VSGRSSRRDRRDVGRARRLRSAMDCDLDLGSLAAAPEPVAAASDCRSPFERAPELYFGSAWRSVASPAPGVARRLPIAYAGGYPMRGRWLLPRYGQLRNAAWAVRNSRVGSAFNPLALKMVLDESERLLADGESLADVLEAYAELLAHP
jgi:hypothetical protein